MMACLEVIYSLSSTTPILLASQEIEPKRGWSYGYMKPKASNILEFFEKMIEVFITEPSEKPLCLSIVLSEKIPQLIEELDKFFSQVNPVFENFKKVLDSTPRIANDEYIDLCLLLQNIENSLPQLAARAASINNLIRQDIVVRNYANGPNYNGLSLWCPKSVRSYKIDRYSKLPIASAFQSYMQLLRHYVKIKD